MSTGQLQGIPHEIRYGEGFGAEMQYRAPAPLSDLGNGVYTLVHAEPMLSKSEQPRRYALATQPGAHAAQPSAIGGETLQALMQTPEMQAATRDARKLRQDYAKEYSAALEQQLMLRRPLPRDACEAHAYAYEMAVQRAHEMPMQHMSARAFLRSQAHLKTFAGSQE
eukprot:2026493-Pleurochrysis_carterae.AAC.2